MRKEREDMRGLTWLSAVSAIVLLVVSGLGGCEKPSGKIRLALNWKPEPEFGGIYAAQQQGLFKANHIEVEVMPGGAGAPTWQLVAAGKVPFAIASADEVIIARAQGADVVAFFATYQTCPQGIMVHEERGLKSISDVFQGGTLAIEKGLAYSNYLEKKYGFDKIKLVSYDGGVSSFMADRNYAQQCFITSEPLTARTHGARPQVFLIADAGYNPYTAVLITRGNYARQNPQIVQAMVKTLREGWQAYLNDPKPSNALMHTLNTEMDEPTFAQAAAAQTPLILPPDTAPAQIGTMTRDRWVQLTQQLLELKVIEKPVAADACFVAGL